LFGTPAAEISIERIRELVDTTPIESLTVEYKVQLSKDWVESVAAMANSYGGLILIGVSDALLPDRLVGVPGKVAIQVADACHDSLEPPWVPEIISVPLSEAGDSVVLVLRVETNRAPRPLLFRHRVPVRLPGRNAPADRLRLAQLFAEGPVASKLTGSVIGQRGLPGLQKVEAWPEPLPIDFMLHSGLLLPVAEDRSWSPLSERGIDSLAQALDGSPLAGLLKGWGEQLAIPRYSAFTRHGFNRARVSRLVSQVASGHPEVPYPVEAIADTTLPDRYGSPTSSLTFAIDFLVRFRLLYAAAGHSSPSTSWRLSVRELYVAIDFMLATLVDDAVVRALAPT
jgi:hypothetical protein